MQIVPLTAVASQTENVLLGNQICQINVYQKTYGMYLDLYVNNALIIGGVVCENRNRIVRYKYLGFIGDLAFNDLQGDENPYYTGLGSRWILLYLTEADLVTYGA